mgnify:CR=1 FL=1
MSALIDQMHSRNVRVILWVTTMINTDSSNFEYGKSKVRSSYIVLAASYFSVKRAIIYPDWMAIPLNGGTVLGRSLVFTATIIIFSSTYFFPPSDYTNPDALAWWHSQMDYLLDIGIDGWKCDGTDPFVFELIVAEGYG